MGQDFQQFHSSRYLRAIWPLLISVLLAGCSAQPRSTYPVLEQSLESDIELGCTNLEDELLKANAIRDAIFEEHGDVISEAYMSSALDVVSEPITGVIFSVIRGMSTSRSSKKYLEAAAAASFRMERLLVLMIDKQCPTGPNEDPAMTDSQVLSELRLLESQLDREEISNKEYLEARKVLLDTLR